MTAIEGTSELDYAEALDVFGLRFRPAPATRPAWLGVTTRNDAGGCSSRRSAARRRRMAAGINVDDEILAIDDFRVRADQLATRLEQYKPGDKRHAPRRAARSAAAARRDARRRAAAAVATRGRSGARGAEGAASGSLTARLSSGRYLGVRRLMLNARV